MKLLCNKCSSPILRDNVNLRTGIAYCETCDEYFRVADHLSPFTSINVAERPYGSKVSIEKKGDDYLINVQAEGFTFTHAFYFSVGIFSLALAAFAFFDNDGLQPAAFFLALSLLAFFGFIDGTYNYYTLSINHRELIFTNALWKLKKTRDYADWKSVRIETIEMEGKPNYKVFLYFFNSRSISFRRTTDLPELQWIAGELYRVKDELALSYSKGAE